ncbi:MAG: YcbK family protein [Mangrovicoccus sp.]
MENNQNDGRKGLTRRGLLTAFAATAVVAAPYSANAFGILRGSGDIRRLKMNNGRTGESIDVIYWVDGRYIKPALREINHFMRDWRQNKSISIDTRTLDIMAASHRLLDVSEPYTLLSGYRTPKTNALLRSSSRGVAKKSLHMLGQAADLRLRNRSVTQIYNAAVTCKSGGVGRYYGSNFVHMDCGPIRTWRG